MTNNLQRRLWEHRHPTYDSFTNRYHCRMLVYYEVFPSAYEAICREKELKKWRREKKNALVNQNNPSWSDLAKEWL
ncbi:MAG: Excinuclease ABC C subunit domain protein [Parcubacteria group bacterium GW2011_GWC2_38_7]|nr:MAG: Excinuclease ABC C subunit domain protein [Parcubacteria group bacterium GW2011_GWC2_38_7]